jgi:hypothetical protein
MRAAALAILLTAAAGPVEAQDVRVDLYTMGVGDELFTMFGHAALCVSEARSPAEALCYNYGTSDFSRPIGLAWEVIQGRARFWVSVSDLPTMLASFELEDRSIYRQRLPLTGKQAARLAQILATDALPANRFYVYNHFLENCSTRPRDHVDAVMDGALRRVTLPGIGTYRDYAAEGLSRSSAWLVPASDLIMGRWVDRPIDAYAAMFIPDVLRDGVTTALLSKAEILYERTGPHRPSKVAIARTATFAVSVLIAVDFLALGFLRPRWDVLLRRLGAVLLGCFGLLLAFAALVSALPELQRNELLLVFFPLDFFLGSRNLRFVRNYATMRLSLLALVALLAGLGVLIQPLWPFWILSAGIVGAIRLSTRARRA